MGGGGGWDARYGKEVSKRTKSSKSRRIAPNVVNNRVITMTNVGGYGNFRLGSDYHLCS